MHSGDNYKKDVIKWHIEDFAEEAAKYDAVKNLAIDELERLFFKARDEIGEKEAQIFSIHKMMERMSPFPVLGIV